MFIIQLPENVEIALLIICSPFILAVVVVLLTGLLSLFRKK